jgi:hypothetical protein
MHPTISYYLATARADDLRREAQRDQLARAARHARRHQPGQPAPRLPATRRRLLTFLRARST